MRKTEVHSIRTNMFSALFYLVFILCLLPVAIFSFKHPDNNWDMLGYMALVIRMDGEKDMKEVHRVIYQLAKENIPKGDYERLIDSSGIRGKFASDPFRFEKILPIHVVKPLYIWLVFIFYKAGFTCRRQQ